MILDFTGVSSGFEVLPEGIYEGEVKKVELKTNKAGDGQYLNFEWEVIDEEGKAKKVWDIASLKPQALWKLKSVLDAFGMQADGSVELEPEDFVGQQAQLKLKIDTYQGKEKNVIEEIKGFDGAVATSGV